MEQDTKAKAVRSGPEVTGNSESGEIPVASIQEAVLMAFAVEVRCISCGCVEFVVPLDGDGPLDITFTANYLCDECEEFLGITQSV